MPGGFDEYPLVTIGIPAYNAEEHILHAIESALSQDWPNKEIVIVDDASTDLTWQLLETFSMHIDIMRIFRMIENAGVAKVRNRILECARGSFLVFFDDDDVSHPSRVERQLKRILEYEKEHADGAPVICHAARKQISTDGTERIEPTMGQREGGMVPSGRPVARRILAGDPLEDGYGAVATCSQMARTKTFRELGGFDPRFRRSEDTEFCVRLALTGGHFVGIADPLVTQKLTKTSDKSLERELSYVLALLEKHKSVFDNHTHYAFCRDWVETKYAFLSRDKLRFARLLALSFAAHPLLTLQRIRYALYNLESNRSFANFHKSDEAAE